jgi:rhamnulokinase
MTANVTGLPVLAGPVEATVIGNVLVQAIASGHVNSLADARARVARHMPAKKFLPQPTSGLDEAIRRYSAIEARWIEDEASVLVHNLSR